MSSELELKAKLFQKLLGVKKQVEYLKKDTQGFNFTYASPELVLGTLNPLLNEAGLFLKTEVLSETHERVFSKYKVQDLWVNKVKQEKEVEVHETLFHLNLKFTWVDTETGFEDSALFTASGINNDEQGQGSAQTYGERYFLLKTFNIPTGKDDPDALGAKRHATAQVQPTANKAPQATQTAKATKATPAKEKAAETAPKQAEAAKPTKAETKQADPKAKLADKDGNLQPNTAAIEPTPEAERKEKAKAYFKKLTDEATALKFLIRDKGVRKFAKVNDWIDSTPVDEVLEIYKELKAKLEA